MINAKQKVDVILARAKKITATAKEEGRDLTDEEVNAVEKIIEQSKQIHLSDSDKQRLDDFMNQPSWTGSPPPRKHGTNNCPGGLCFRDPATGRTVRALGANENICSEPLDDGEPHLAGRAISAWLTGREAPGALQLGGSDTGGGYLMQPQLSEMVIDLARAASVCLQAGAQTIPMDTNELNLVRVDSGPTPHWRPEGSPVLASSATFGRIVLRSKTLACIVPITLEMLEDAPNAPYVIEDCIARAIASEIDRACLNGNGSESEPMGLRNASGTNSVSSIGVPTDYSDVTNAVGEILTDNYSGELSDLSWVAHPTDGKCYAGLVDTLGQPLQPGPWVAPLRKFYTTSCPQDEGSGTDSSMFLGDFSQLLLGVRRSGVQLRRIPGGTATDSSGKSYNAVSQLLEHLVAHVRVDVALMRPSWFCVLSGLVTG